MDIDARFKEMQEIMLNPSYVAKSIFGKAYAASLLQTEDRLEYLTHHNWDIPDTISLDIKHFIPQKNYVLYSGGKDSLLTYELLKHFGIESTRTHVMCNKAVQTVDADLVLRDDIILDLYCHIRKRMPKMYGYLLTAAKHLPAGSVLWMGLGFEPHARDITTKSIEETDIMLYDINNDPDIPIKVYSAISCLSEFDVFRLVKKLYLYENKNSYLPSEYGKKERIELYDSLLNLQKRICLAEQSEYIKNHIGFCCPEIKLRKPLIYDFRRSVSTFLHDKRIIY